MQKVLQAILTVFVLCLLVVTPALARGALLSPTADVIGVGSMELDFLHHRSKNFLGVQLGVYEGISVGIRQDLGGPFYGTLKAALAEETAQMPGFALGADLSLDRQHLYAVLSKQLGNPSLRGHLALGSGRYSRAMASLTYVLNPVRVNNAPTTSVFLEYDGQGLNGGLVAQFSPEFKANIGLAMGYGLSLGVNYKVAF